jgi:hypothetical protein
MDSLHGGPCRLAVDGCGRTKDGLSAVRYGPWTACVPSMVLHADVEDHGQPGGPWAAVRNGPAVDGPVLTARCRRRRSRCSPRLEHPFLGIRLFDHFSTVKLTIYLTTCLTTTFDHYLTTCLTTTTRSTTTFGPLFDHLFSMRTADEQLISTSSSQYQAHWLPYASQIDLRGIRHSISAGKASSGRKALACAPGFARRGPAKPRLSSGRWPSSSLACYVCHRRLVCLTN